MTGEEAEVWADRIENELENVLKKESDFHIHHLLDHLSIIINIEPKLSNHSIIIFGFTVAMTISCGEGWSTWVLQGENGNNR
jgi:hypothetical protein